MLKHYFLAFLIVVNFLSLVGCGRATDPKPPEVLSPQPVTQLVVAALPSGVQFDWRSPQSSQEGKELRQIDGYRIYRKDVQRAADLYDRKKSFEEVAFVVDTHLQELEDLREKAKEEGQIVRKVKVADRTKIFTWIDDKLEVGKTYAYMVVPVNQGSEDGAVDQLIKVIFRGIGSEIRPLPYVRNAYSF